MPWGRGCGWAWGHFSLTQAEIERQSRAVPARTGATRPGSLGWGCRSYASMRQCCFESFQLLGHEAVVGFELQGPGFQLHRFGGVAGAVMGFGGGVEIGGVGG